MRDERLILARPRDDLKPAPLVSPNAYARKLLVAILQHGFTNLPEGHEQQFENAVLILATGFWQTNAEIFARDAKQKATEHFVPKREKQPKILVPVLNINAVVQVMPRRTLQNVLQPTIGQAHVRMPQMQKLNN